MSAKMFDIAKRDGGWTCHYCGVQLVPRGREAEYYRRSPVGGWIVPPGTHPPTVDHKLARSKGGADDLDNLVLACCECNVRKGHRYTYEQFLELMRGERV